MIRHRKPPLFSQSGVKWTPTVVRASLNAHFSFSGKCNARVQASRDVSLISGEAEINPVALVGPSSPRSLSPLSSERYSVLNNWPNFKLPFPPLPPKAACTYTQWLCDYWSLPECISRYFSELWFIWTSSTNALSDVATAAMCASFHPFPSGRAAWVEGSFASRLERKGGLGRFYLYAFLFLLLIFICNESILRRQRTERG